MTDQELINDLAEYIEANTEYDDVTREEHGVVVNGEFEMFGPQELKAEVSSFFAQRMSVSGYSVGVVAPAGSLTGNFVVDKIEEVPNA